MSNQLNQQTEELRLAAQDACKKRGARYITHSIILDPKAPIGVRYEVHGRNASGGKLKFDLPPALTEKLTEKLSSAFSGDMPLPQIAQKTNRSGRVKS